MWHYQVLPAHFVRETGLSTNRGTLLRDPQGKLWSVVIKLTTQKRVRLSSGWHAFLEGNKLKEGDTCLFKYIRNEGNLTLLQVLKDSSTVDRYKRGRGKPPRILAADCLKKPGKKKNQEFVINTENDDDEPKAYTSHKAEDPCFVTTVRKSIIRNGVSTLVNTIWLWFHLL